MRACHPEDEPSAGIEERIERVEKAIEKGVVARPQAAAPAPAAQPAPTAKPAAAGPAKPAAKPGPALTPPPEYLQALELFAQDNPPMRATLASMRFAGLEDGAVRVEFAKKNMMHMKMLERKQASLDQAFSTAFGQPMRAVLRQEGDAAPLAPGTASAEARRRIEQSYDVFGRDKIEITD